MGPLSASRDAIVDHPTCATADHARQSRAGKACDGTDMDADEVIDDFRFDLHERAVTAEAGVVDHQGKRLISDARLKLRERARVREVGCQHLRVRVRFVSQPLG